MVAAPARKRGDPEACMRIQTRPEERAQWLLGRMRQTPMRRGALSKSAQSIKRDMARVMAEEGVPAVLARRLAFQLAFKFRPNELYGDHEWRAMARFVCREIRLLKDKIGMKDQRINAALPKLSAGRIMEFLEELTRTDSRIARTILHAAVNTADPIAVGRRYMAEYRLVVRKLSALDPSMARTLAAATFSAGVPLSKAMDHLRHFSALMRKYHDSPAIARRLARATFRTRALQDATGPELHDERS